MRASPYPIPAWRVVLDGVDLTERLAPRLLDLSLTESRGDEADQVDLRVHDHDGRLALPRRGVTLQVAIGYEGSGLFDKGTFKVDDVEHSGSPDIITIRARSADLTGAVRRRRERSWHDTTLPTRGASPLRAERNRQGAHGNGAPFVHCADRAGNLASDLSSASGRRRMRLVARARGTVLCRWRADSLCEAQIDRVGSTHNQTDLQGQFIPPAQNA